MLTSQHKFQGRHVVSALNDVRRLTADSDTLHSLAGC